MNVNGNKLRSYCTTSMIPLVLLVSCIIQKLPNRKYDDGSSSLTKIDSASIRLYSPDHVGKIQDFMAQNNKLIYEEVSAREIRQIINENRYTWILDWATWCPHGIFEFPKAVRLRKKYSDKGIAFISLCQNYDIRSMTNAYKEASFYEQAYILDSKVYGPAELKKIKKFGADICPSCPEIIGTPNHFIFDQQGKLVYYHYGEIQNPDTLEFIFR